MIAWAQVIVWKETAQNVWQPIYTSPPTLLEASVNSVAWAPHELGLILAAGASDGAIAVIALNASGTCPPPPPPCPTSSYPTRRFSAPPSAWILRGASGG